MRCACRSDGGNYFCSALTTHVSIGLALAAKGDFPFTAVLAEWWIASRAMSGSAISICLKAHGI